MKVKTGIALFALIAANTMAHGAELGFARVFTDHAVLQRDQPITLWGTAEPAQKITVTLNGSAATATANQHGKWRIELPGQAAGGPFALRAESDGKSASLNDIMVGDVYLCSGQSNMEFALRQSTNAWATLSGPGNSQLRFLNVPKASEFAPQDDIRPGAQWKVVAQDTVGDASAVCFYMARSLQAKFKVPVGFVNASWGGTTIQGWIGAERLGMLHDYAPGVAAVQEHAADPDKAMKHEEARQEAWWDKHDPAAKQQRAWAAAGFDDSSWQQMTPGGSWKASGIDGLRDFDGVVWFRTTVDLSAGQAAKANQLLLGPVDIYDTTWVNGVRVGGGSTAWMWRDYSVPKGVFKAGRNVIAMRVLSGGDGGGLTGQPNNRVVKMSDGQAIQLSPAWRYKIGSHLKGPQQPAAPWDVPTSLTTLYNGMVAPLTGYKFRLAAWYQGESNAGAGAEYRTLLPLMMRDWRQQFGQPALPFLIVQLPGYGSAAKQPGQSGWAELRQSQADAVHADAHAALVVTLDVGDRFDIHPTEKTVVGERLARAAQALAYGDAVTPGGPEAVSVQRAGNDIVVQFRQVNGGLATYSSDKAIGFEVCTAQGCRYADATASGDRVVLAGANAAGVTRVRYAWADAPFINLFSADDLPAAPFQLDLK
jgi:hypothetical protein